jgi:G:T-mismatch repair DNA endonuclease (very short patch repair protein)
MVNKLKEFYKANEKDGKVNGMLLKSWLKKNQDVNDYLNNLLIKHPNFNIIANIIYCIIRDIDFESIVCKNCKKPLNVRAMTQVSNYCSAKCAANDPELQKRKSETIASDPDYWKKRQEKIIKTNLERYGTKTPAQNKDIAKKMSETCANDPNHWKKRNEKSEKTCMERYGVKNASSTIKVREKVKKTNLKKYGVENVNKLPETLEKIKNTCLEKYGVDCQFKRKEVIETTIKKSWNKILTWQDFVTPLFTFDEYTGYSRNQDYKWKCTKCGNEFVQHLYHTKISDLSTVVPRCLKCYPINIGSYKEIDLQNFCAQYFNIEKNNRQLIKPLELDIIIPEKKIAIEFNGIYWHSDQIKNDQMYHLNKTLKCEEVGYKLIHIWEYDWINSNKQNILKEKIKALLGVDQTKIYARKCEIKEIDSKTKNEFLNKHHIQGEDKSKVKLGLFYENELVAVMTFGKPRFNNNYEWELIRYATKSGYQVLGGAGKLLSYFERNYTPKSIITYADRSYSQGNMYRQIGFSLNKISDPSYIWTKGNEILSRYQCQKHKLKELLGDNYNERLSENENMSLNGFYKLYDCGNFVFEKHFK